MTGELAGRVAEHINHSRLHVAMLFQDPEDVIETVLEALGAERDEWCMKAAALQPLTAPPADMGPLTELIGYFAQAVEDGEPLDAQQALDLALETRRRMLAPIHQWMQRMGGPS